MKNSYYAMAMAAFCCCTAFTSEAQLVCNASFTFTSNGLTITTSNTSSGSSAPNYTWTWGDSSSPSYQVSPTHTYANAGMYMVCLTMWDSLGCQDSFCDTVIVTPTAIAENTADIKGLSMQPNPAGNTASLVFSLVKPAEVSVSFFDLTGKLVLKQKPLLLDAGKQLISQDLGGLDAGVYFAEIKAGNAVSRVKFVRLD